LLQNEGGKASSIQKIDSDDSIVCVSKQDAADLFDSIGQNAKNSLRVNVFRSFLENRSDTDAFVLLRGANKRHVMSRRLIFAAFHDNRLSSKGHTALLGVFIRLEAVAASERSAESHKRRFCDAPPRTKWAGGSETNSSALGQQLRHGERPLLGYLLLSRVVPDDG